MTEKLVPRSPEAARCRKAIKILEQFERLATKLGIQLSAARRAHLTNLRDGGTIKVSDLPATLRLEFPGEFADMTLDAIRTRCASASGAELKMLYSEIESRSIEDCIRDFYRRRLPKYVASGERLLWLDDVAVRIASAGASGMDFLLGALDTADTLQTQAAVLGLSFNKRLPARTRARILGKFRPLLDDRRATVVICVIDALRVLRDHDVADRVRALRQHASPFVVGAVLRYLAWCSPVNAVPLLKKALTSPHYIVRENAIDELDDMECVDALPWIRPLLRDRHKHVRQAATTAVQNLEATLQAKAHRRSG